jgi:SAM-dependent methyltransferase
MHAEALSFIHLMAATYGPFPTVADFGGRDVNGSPRPFFPGADYTSIDTAPGPGVDVVADARTWTPPVPLAAVVCAEVAEHCPEPDRLIASAHRALAPGGSLIFTAAAPPREPHSAVDGGTIRPGEHYVNIEPAELRRWLIGWSWSHVEHHSGRGDVYAVARK